MKKNNLDEIKVLDAQQMNAIQGGKAPKKNGSPQDLIDIDNPETPT